MILHKYLNAKYGIEAVKEGTLKVSIPSELNDPFEFLPKDIGVWTKTKVKKFLKNKERQNRIYQQQKNQRIVKNKQQFKKVLEDIDSLAENLLGKFKSKDFWETIQKSKRNLDEYMRFICFSSEGAKHFDEILMWSHYSEKHTGVRLHYNSKNLVSKKSELVNVIYSQERAPVDYSIEESSNEFLNQLMLAMHTKSECWQYEKEYRLFIDQNICFTKQISEKLFHFVQIPIEYLVRIDLGLNFEQKYINQLNSIMKGQEYLKIKIYKCELDKHEYKFNYKLLN